MAAMTSTSDEKWQPFICFLSQVGLRTYQHPGIILILFKKRCNTSGGSPHTCLHDAMPRAVVARRIEYILGNKMLILLNTSYVVWQKSNETDFLLTVNFILFYKSRLSPSQ